jgi:ABC-2 type transport system ATP-binding protein
VVRHERATLTLGLATDGSGPEVRALLDQVDPGRTAVRSFAVHAASLDDVFLALTGHRATEPSAAKPTAAKPTAAKPTAAQPSSLEEESAHV